MLKLTISDVPDFYSALANHKRAARVVVLSGGYTRDDACKRLAANRGMITRFSRALTEDLKYSRSDAAFNATLANSIDEIYRASTVKVEVRLYEVALRAWSRHWKATFYSRTAPFNMKPARNTRDSSR
jgi:hypothetical protein